MIQKDLIPEIMKAAQAKTVQEAALHYVQMGFSVLPLKGKRPALPDWKQYQEQAAAYQVVSQWNRSGLLQNVGLVCGAVSGNLVVLDLDGAAGYPAFAALFPKLADTFTVVSGSGVGKHVYWRAVTLPESIKAMGTPIGNIEICAEGRQVVAPPSVHPMTHKVYRVEKAIEILNVPDLADLVVWVESFKTKVETWQPPQNLPAPDHELNPRLIEAVARYFSNRGYRQLGEWLHGRCIYPHRHSNGDRNPSFGYNVLTGYGHCFRCGTILTREICDAVNIQPDDYGGLTKKGRSAPATKHNLANSENSYRSSDNQIPPHVPSDSIENLRLPKWLKMYLEWAGKTGNQTPMSFHLAAGLWLLSVAVGRRVYGEAPWGVKIYPNLYLMLIASTTYYRKSTAYKLAEQIAREATPHMLMPTPGSPERFQEALSGKLPANYDKLTREQQARLMKAQPFAAQRGLLKDEVAGLFGTINKKDYMTGMKDLLMELYDCPNYSDKDTQTGLTIVENAALSILGVTTPSGLSAAVSDADWSNGLLIRFALLTPEVNYVERPPAKAYQHPPQELINQLRVLHEKLPMPEKTEEGYVAPRALALKVDCWKECQSYGDTLRQQCNPQLDNELDERLKGVYGRMHVQAFKLAQLMAALDWLESAQPIPIVTREHWEIGKAIADLWRSSAARLLLQIDRSGEAVQEQREQTRVLNLLGSMGSKGMSLRDLYRALNLPAKRARQIAQDLQKAGLIIEREYGRAEWYIAVEFADDSAIS